MARDSLYLTTCDAPDFREGWRDLRRHYRAPCRFIENEGSEYLLGLLSRISKESEVRVR
jgi:hypothetical protein